MYRAKLTQQLQEINAQIYALTQDSQHSRYPWTNIIDIDEDTSDTFIRLFWGHIGGKLKMNQNENENENIHQEQDSDFDFQKEDNYDDDGDNFKEEEEENNNKEEEDNHEEEMNIEDMIENNSENDQEENNKPSDPLENKALLMSKVEKRKEFLAYSLSARQRSFLFAQNNPTISIVSFQHFSICTFDVPYSIYDYVRYIFFTKIFGPSFPFHQVYPHISPKKMKYIFKKFLSHDSNIDFETLGIPKITFDFLQSENL